MSAPSPAEANCIDIIRPYAAELQREGLPPVQLLGGIGSVALRHKDTVIKTDEQRIIAPAGLELPNFRPDGNLRDIETLVLSTRDEDRQAVQDLGEATMGDSLIVEVFPFHDEQRTQELVDKPFGGKALKTFLSDRYMPADRQWVPGETQVRRTLFPFDVPIDDEALRPWTLEIGDDITLPVPPPGEVIINYLIRSISGLRGKDAEKVEEMARAIFEKAPETVDWIVDGPGKDEFRLARILHTLRESNWTPEVLTLGGLLEVRALWYGNLKDSPAFLLSDVEGAPRRSAVRLASVKSRLLHLAESSDFIVTQFQRHGEQRIGTVVHND